jgi:hypothetical protein
MGAQTTYGFQPEIGFAGSLDRTRPYATLTMKNVEASGAMPFGAAVCRDLASPASDMSALLPALETDKVAGIVLREDTFARTWTDADGVVQGQLSGTGLIPGTMFTCVTMGRMLVRCEDAVVPGDPLWVRCTVGDPAAVEFLGSLTNADEGTETIDCSKFAQWETTGAAAGLAYLSFDFTRSAA